MPIYEFLCRDCNAQFEVLTSAAQRDEAKCPTCRSSRTARRLSLTAPAQIKSGGSARPVDAGCGMPSCCGGACNSGN